MVSARILAFLQWCLVATAVLMAAFWLLVVNMPVCLHPHESVLYITDTVACRAPFPTMTQVMYAVIVDPRLAIVNTFIVLGAISFLGALIRLLWLFAVAYAGRAAGISNDLYHVFRDAKMRKG